LSSLYLYLDLAAVSAPLLLSFDKRVNYFRNWPKVFLASLIVGIPFIVWDILFTSEQVWGFNEDYLIGVEVFNLPLEEVLFFFVVPFACTFIYECCKYYLRKVNTIRFDIIVLSLLFVYSLSLLLLSDSGLYSLISSVLGLSVLILWLFNRRTRHLGVTFVLSMIPFFIMNGALTGMFTSEPIVWYDSNEMVDVRMWSIPIQDVVYGMSLIFSVIFVFEKLNK
jgi:lycopene cyclase domain-containing protein